MNTPAGCTDETFLCVEEKYEHGGTVNLFLIYFCSALEILYHDTFYIVGFEVLTAMVMKSSISWNITM
jgi:hypothetical protein